MSWQDRRAAYLEQVRRAEVLLPPRRGSGRRRWPAVASQELPPQVENIFRDAEKKFNVTREEIVSPAQFTANVRARRSIARTLRTYGYSLSRIGRYLGGRHHTTVCNYLQGMEPLEPKPWQPDESGVWAI